MRKSMLLVTGVMVAATSLGVGASAYAGPRTSNTKTVQIVGTNIFKVNRFIETTYRFPDSITVRQGQFILFQNKSDDVHTITFVRAADLPSTINGVFNCRLCNAVNNIYGGGRGLPKGVQIDNGKLTDDESDHDADTPDPAVPASVRSHLPFPVLIQDFNVPAYTSAGQTIVGDSTIVPAVNTGVGFAARTIQITVRPGTYHYFCTFHAWMQGTLVVTS